MKLLLVLLFVLLPLSACQTTSLLDSSQKDVIHIADLAAPATKTLKISREKYADKLYGFWLGQSIANWTGLVTEMDKIGDIGELKTGNFYTREDWGKPDQPSIWGQGVPSDLSDTIDFVFRDPGEIWGSDDDTDIEYMYQHLLATHHTSMLTAAQIRAGWLKHIKQDEENYLWVSNQRALDLMNQGMLPPETGDPSNNEHFDMIDAQLITEIFGLLAPTRADIALKMAELPIQTTARRDAEYIAKFYVVMHSLASAVDDQIPIKEQISWMATEARQVLPDTSYAAAMFDYVTQLHDSGIPWEHARDLVYERYQVNQLDDYDITSKNLYCNGCFAAGINFAASIISLHYGEGDIKQTIKIGSLAGWDSDNPTATWGGLIGFMIGKQGVEKAFDRQFANQFNIHRTRQNFPNDGIDTFENMAETGLKVIDKVVIELMDGSIENNMWIIPITKK